MNKIVDGTQVLTLHFLILGVMQRMFPGALELNPLSCHKRSHIEGLNLKNYTNPFLDD